jgi:hypothetical protein
MTRSAPSRIRESNSTTGNAPATRSIAARAASDVM